MTPGFRRWLRVPGPPRDLAKRDVDDEVAFHLAMREQELRSQGLNATSARAQAEREFGDVELNRARLRAGATTREREKRRTLYLDELKQDLRYALRSLRERPGFSTVVVLTLTLGLATTTTIYTVFRGVMLRPLPIAEAERVVVPHTFERGLDNQMNVSYADFLDWRERGVFAAVGVHMPGSSDLRIGPEAERFEMALVSEDFFAALGARAQLGRVLGRADFAPGAPIVLVISHAVWQSRFGGQPDVIGRTVGSRRGATIVGVLERGAEWPRNAQLWFPLLTAQGVPAAWLERDSYVFGSVARLRTGTTVEGTRVVLDGMARIIEQQIPSERARISVTAKPIQQELLGESLPRALWILLAAVGFVLLIGCANIANLLLVRGAARRREFAVRIALGARTGRLARQLLTESIVLAVLGGVLGIVLSRWGVDLLLHYAPADLPRIDEISIDGTVFLVGVGLTFTTALLFALAPMIQATRVGAAESIADTTARTVGGRRFAQLRRTLVVSELALSVMLLVGAGLLVRSLVRLQQTDPGFETDNLITFSLRLAPSRYPDNAAEAAFYAGLGDGLQALPGVTSASIGSALPIGGGGYYLGRSFLAEGQREPPNGTELKGQWNVVGPRYFGTMGITLLRGREFDARDDSANVPVMIVNKTFADRMFPDQNPLGKRVRSWRDENLLREIVGVVSDVRYFGVGDKIRPLVYVPHGQNTWSTMSIMVRSDRGAANMMASIRRYVASLDPALAVADVSTMNQAHSASMARPRFNALLLAGFAALALLLASLGIYGVLAYGVAQRAREIGVRMALGARARDVIRLVLGEAAWLVGLGVLLGLAGAYLGTRALQELLYEIDARDPITFAVVVGVLVLVAVAASYLPMRRATRVAPNVALQGE
jgi:putative ABC transport system permease protein